MTTVELTRHLLWLKVRLIFRDRSTQKYIAAAGLIIGLIGTVVGVIYVFSLDITAQRDTHVMLAFTAVSVGWLISTIVLGGGEGTLDATRFGLFPLTVRQICIGFFAASFIGFFAPATLILLLSAVRFAESVSGGVVLALAALSTTATAVLSSRLGLSAMSSLLRGRRTREVAGFVAVLFGASAGILPQFVRELSEILTDSRQDLLRSILRWVPWGWAPEAAGLAAEGRPVLALVPLAASIGFGAVLVDLWRRILARLLTTREASRKASVGDDLVPSTLERFGRSPVVAVWARTLHQLRRDPREFLEVAGFLPLVIVLAIPSIEAIQNNDQEVVLASAGLGLALGLTSLNMFGADGRSFGVDALAIGDVSPVVVGKALARITLGVPAVLVVAIALAAVTSGWAFVIPSVLISLVALLSITAVGMSASARFAFPLPEKIAFAGQGLDGCSTGIIRMVSFLFASMIAAVGVVPVVVTTLLVSPLLGTLVGLGATAYGVGVFWVGSRFAGGWATRNTPELFQTLAKAR